MSTKARSDAIHRARRALDEIGLSIEYDRDAGTSEGHDDVRRGLDAMASTLWELGDLDLDLDAEPLDRILAEMGEDKPIVEMAAELIDLLGRVTYTGLSQEDAEQAEELRGELYGALSTLLDEIAAEEP